VLKKLDYSSPSEEDAELSKELTRMISECYANMSDDFNTAKTLAVLFEMSAKINDFRSGNLSLGSVSESIFKDFKQTYITFMENILGIREEDEHNQQLLDGVVKVLIELRKKSRVDKNFALSDKIRDDLKAIGVQLMDGRMGR